MPFIETFAETTTDGAAQQLIEADAAVMGYIPNYTRLFAHRPEVYAAWKQLNNAIKAGMDPRRYELATIAAARRLRSTYCMLAHSTVMLDSLDFEPGELRDIVADPRTAVLDDVEIAIMELSDRVAADATSIERADVDRLRAHGLSDAEILDAILAAAARCFFSKTLDAAGVQPDARYAELEPQLRETLTVGRPIETAAQP
jgi:uncharacterized peroxidase-related enzyme